jgi:uncharacterized protein
MRLVIDTNVLISALLNAGRVPAVVLAMVRERRDVVLYDARILAEYRSVLARPKFVSIPAERSEAMVLALIEVGQDLGEVEAWSGAMLDDDDRMFVEVAIAGKADVLLTGNTKHYPRDAGFDVMGPTALLGVLEAQAIG